MRGHYGIRTKTHKLIHFPKYGDGNYWELFDLKKDPEELINIFDKPQYRVVQKALDIQLKALEREVGVR